MTQYICEISASSLFYYRETCMFLRGVNAILAALLLYKYETEHGQHQQQRAFHIRKEGCCIVLKY